MNDQRPSVRPPDLPVWRSSSALFLGLLAIGLSLRIALYRTGWMGFDSDAAAGAVAAIRGAHGHLSLVFPGGDYGGMAVTWFEAVLVKVFGFHLFVLWLVDTLLALACSAVLWSVARRVLPPVAAATAAGVFSFFPPLWLFWSGREYVFWEPAVLFALLCAKSSLDWSERRRGRDAAVAGLYAGLAIWSYPLVLSLVAPVAIMFAWAARRRIDALWRAGLGAVLGVAPWTAYFVIHGASAFATQSAAETRLAALRHAIGTVLPASFLGGQQRLGLTWALPSPSHGVLVATGLTLWTASVLSCAVWLVGRRWALAASSGSVVLWPLLLAMGHVPLSLATFRYGFMAVPGVLIEAAFVLSKLRCGFVLGAVAIGSSVAVPFHDTGGFAAQPACLPALTAVQHQLQAAGRTRVWGSYWLAADLTVCGYPHVVAGATAVSRDPVGVQAAATARRSTYVVFDGLPLDARIASYVASSGVHVRRAEVDGFRIWMFDGKVEPSTIHLPESAF